MRLAVERRTAAVNSVECQPRDLGPRQAIYFLFFFSEMFGKEMTRESPIAGSLIVERLNGSITHGPGSGWSRFADIWRPP